MRAHSCGPCRPYRPYCPPQRCRPGCTLPCCAPRCTYIPRPRYTSTCGPCPPGCTLPCCTRYMPSRCRPYRPRCSPCGDPCTPCPDPCPPPCDPCDPCRPRRRCRPTSCAPRDCDPCKLTNLCCPKRPISCRKPRACSPCYPVRHRRRTICSPCPSPCGRDEDDLCNDQDGDNEVFAQTQNPSKGPTDWFLRKSGQLSECKPQCTPPHSCPWEADVTVSGTVRAHCTSTAVEVAKRLTGKFVSRGKRYTTAEGGCEADCLRDDDQTMTLGCLDDGSRLDFSRKRCSKKKKKCIKTDNVCANNATLEKALSTSTWRDSESENKSLLRANVPFIRSIVDGNYKKERKGRDRSRKERKEAPITGSIKISSSLTGSFEATKQHPPFSKAFGKARHGARTPLSSSDTDISAYRTASETNRGNEISFSRYPSNVYVDKKSAKRKSRNRRRASLTKDEVNRHEKLSSRACATKGNSFSQRSSSDTSCNKDRTENHTGNEEVLREHGEFRCESECDYDDLESVYSFHHLHGRSMAEQCAQATERQHCSPNKHTHTKGGKSQPAVCWEEDTEERYRRRHHYFPKNVSSEEELVRQTQDHLNFSSKSDMDSFDTPVNPKSKYLSHRESGRSKIRKKRDNLSNDSLRNYTSDRHSVNADFGSDDDVVWSEYSNFKDFKAEKRKSTKYADPNSHYDRIVQSNKYDFQKRKAYHELDRKNDSFTNKNPMREWSYFSSDFSREEVLPKRNDTARDKNKKAPKTYLYNSSNYSDDSRVHSDSWTKSYVINNTRDKYPPKMDHESSSIGYSTEEMSSHSTVLDRLRRSQQQHSHRKKHVSHGNGL